MLFSEAFILLLTFSLFNIIKEILLSILYSCFKISSHSPKSIIDKLLLFKERFFKIFNWFLLFVIS